MSRGRTIRPARRSGSDARETMLEGAPPMLLVAGLLALAALLLCAARLLGLRPGPWAAAQLPLPTHPVADALRAAGAGVLVGMASTAGAAAAALAVAELSAWDRVPGPEVVALICVAVSLALIQSGPLGRLPLLLGAAIAGLVPWASAPLVQRLSENAHFAPLPVGLVAAVLFGVLLASGRRTGLVALARSAAIDAAGDGVLVVDARGHILHASGAANDVLGLGAEAAGRRSRPSLPATVRSLLSDPSAQRLRLESASKNFYEAWTTQRPRRGPMKRFRAVLFRDITERHHDERHLTRLAHYDSLTGLANRRIFLENLEECIDAAQRAGERAALLYLDLDRFKEINDSLGHAAGDTMLQALAERTRYFLASEELSSLGILAGSHLGMARLAGDEFALVAPRMADPGAAAELARSMIQLLSRPIELGGRSVSVSASVGVALFPDDAQDVETLIRHADAALYAAKSRGRNRFVFYESAFDVKAERRHAIEHNLREAIEREELRLHYQPKVEVASQTVVGFEALLRWKSRELGDVGPAEFIPVAEERGMISEIGSWCLDEACRQIRSWQQAGLRVVPTSVNVSSAQFRESDLQREVCEALKRHNVDPQLLELELTESLLLAEGDETALALRDLRAIGIRIALDDFGTGYSALTYLNRFSLDVLKMDRGLLREIDTNGSAAGIAAAVVSMAHSLGMSVVAEGIDSEPQLDVLREMKCDQIQGWLYAPALPAEEAQRFLAALGEEPPLARPVESPIGRIDTPETTEGAEEELAPAPADFAEDGVSPDTQAGADAADRRVLLLDADGTLGPLALRLARLGVDVHHANGADEARLLVSQEKAAIRLLVVPPSVDLAGARGVVDQMARELGTRPPFIVVGEEPDARVRGRIRDAGATWVLWTPFDDAELRFVARSAMALPHQLAQRREPRIPTDLLVKVQAGGLRAVTVLSSLSARGAFIEMSEPLPIGSHLRLELELPSERLRVFARVVHEQQDGKDGSVVSTAGMGVVFYGVDRHAELALRKTVEERSARYQP